MAKSMFFVFWSWLPSFWGRFGSPNGGQKHEKVVPQSHSKSCLKNDRFLIDFGGPFGVPNGVRKVQIRGPKSDLRSSRVSGALRRSILDGFLIILGPLFGLFSEGFRTSLNDHTHVFKTFAATFGEVFWRD